MTGKANWKWLRNPHLWPGIIKSHQLVIISELLTTYAGPATEAVPIHNHRNARLLESA